MFGFEEALRLLKIGAHVQRDEWRWCDHLKMVKGRVYARGMNGVMKSKWPTDPQIAILAEDWIIHTGSAKHKEPKPERVKIPKKRGRKKKPFIAITD